MNVLAVNLLERRPTCKNSKFSVYSQHVIDSACFEVKDYLIVQPKQQLEGLFTGVAILPLLNSKVGLIKIFRPATNDFSWEIPHGFIEGVEQVETSAMRELKEETGLVASDIISLGYITPDSGVL